MLEFNSQHKSAYLSGIKTKLDKAKKIGKVIMCGSMISATLLLSGCGSPGLNKNGTAVILENDNAVIVEIVDYDYGGYGTKANYIILKTAKGEQILVAVENVQIINGENSHEIAEELAESLISETEKVTYYEDVVEYGKSR